MNHLCSLRMPAGGGPPWRRFLSGNNHWGAPLHCVCNQWRERHREVLLLLFDPDRWGGGQAALQLFTASRSGLHCDDYWHHRWDGKTFRLLNLSNLSIWGRGVNNLKELIFIYVFGLNPECTSDACSPTTVEAQPSFLTEFSKRLIWQVMAPEKTAVALNILGDGLAESSQPCPDGMQYLVAHSKADSSGGQTRYCKGGSVTRLDLANGAVVTLQVQPKAEVSVLFQTSAGPLSKFLVTRGCWMERLWLLGNSLLDVIVLISERSS